MSTRPGLLTMETFHFLNSTIQAYLGLRCIRNFFAGGVFAVALADAKDSLEGATGVEYDFAVAFNDVMVAMIDGTTGSLTDMMATLTALIPVCFPDINPKTPLVVALSFVKVKLPRVIDASVAASRGKVFFSRMFAFNLATEHTCACCHGGPPIVLEASLGIEVPFSPLPLGAHPLRCFESLLLKDFFGPGSISEGPDYLCEECSSASYSRTPSSGPGQQRFIAGKLPQVLVCLLSRDNGTGAVEHINSADPVGFNILVPYSGVSVDSSGAVNAVTVRRKAEYKLAVVGCYDGSTSTNGTFTTAALGNDDYSWIKTKDMLRLKFKPGAFTQNATDVVYVMYELVITNEAQAQQDEDETPFQSKRLSTCSPGKEELVTEAFRTFNSTHVGLGFLSLCELKSWYVVTNDHEARRAIKFFAGKALQQNFKGALRSMNSSIPLHQLMGIVSCGNPHGFKRTVHLPATKSNPAPKITVPDESQLSVAIAGGFAVQAYYGKDWKYATKASRSKRPDLDLIISLEKPSIIRDIVRKFADNDCNFFFESSYDIDESCLLNPNICKVISVYDRSDQITNQFPRSANWLRLHKNKDIFEGFNGALDAFAGRSMFLDMKPSFGAMYQLICVDSTALSHILDTFDTEHSMTMLQVYQDSDGYTTASMYIPNIGSLQKKEIVFSASTRALVEATFVSNMDKQLARVKTAAATFPLAIGLNSSRIQHLGYFARFALRNEILKRLQKRLLKFNGRGFTTAEGFDLEVDETDDEGRPKKILLLKKAESEVADQVIANFGFVFKLGGTELRGKLSISSDANVGAAVSAISEILMRLDIEIGDGIVDGAPMAQSSVRAYTDT